MIVGIGLVSVGMLVGFELLYYAEIGWAQQSRYVLPFGVGALLYAGCLRRWERMFGPRPTQRFLLICALATGAMHVWALAVVMTRFQVTQRFKALGALHGAWLPAVGPQLPLLATTVGGVLLVVLMVRARRVDTSTRLPALADAELDGLLAEPVAVVPASRLPSGDSTLGGLRTDPADPVPPAPAGE
jgi:hypothetical protein